MAANTSLAALASGDFGYDQARHLLARAGFGGTPSQIRELADAGLTKAVDHVLRYEQFDDGDLDPPYVDPDVIRPLSDEERTAQRKARREEDRDTLEAFRKRFLAARAEDRKMFRTLQRWWLQRMLTTPRPMEENLTLFWHGHFATGHRAVRDAFLMYQQNALFRENAKGNFATLTRGVVHDPAMIKYLNNDRNVKRRPNENLARELMELFTLGEGNYTEQDIKEGARALTGYSYRDNAFAFNERLHDQGTKRILGARAKLDGDGFVNILLQHPACPRFIALKLYRHFVADVSDDWHQLTPDAKAAVRSLAEELIRNRYELDPTLRTLLSSQHFYDASVVGNKIKSPTQLVVGVVRGTNAPSRHIATLIEAMRLMGQQLFEPPSVAGWEVGRSWINTSTLFARQNLCTFVISGKHPSHGRWTADALDYDPRPLLAGLDSPTPEAKVNYLVDALLGAHIAPARREPLVRFVAERTDHDESQVLVGLLLLITAMPEYQLC